MPLKFMLDTNCFDFIFEHQLLQKMINARANGKAEFYLTQVQLDEIEAFQDKKPQKYNYVRQVIEKVPVDEVYMHGAYLGTDESTSRGYRGPKIGHITLEEHDPLFDHPKSKLTDSHPVGHRGDLDITCTAHYKNMDYIVTKNEKHFSGIVKRLQIESGSKLKVIFNIDLPKFL
jgi:hypothetical protein